MKRSEMVLRIATLITLGEITPKGEKPENRKVTADKILALVEKLGMEPPIIKEKSFKIGEDGQMTYAVHEWEKE